MGLFNLFSSSRVAGAAAPERPETGARSIVAPSTGCVRAAPHVRVAASSRRALQRSNVGSIELRQVCAQTCRRHTRRVQRPRRLQERALVTLSAARRRRSVFATPTGIATGSDGGALGAGDKRAPHGDESADSCCTRARPLLISGTIRCRAAMWQAANRGAAGPRYYRARHRPHHCVRRLPDVCVPGGMFLVY